MKIITWNIGEDERNKNGQLTMESYKYIIDTIKQEQVEIICLQEAVTSSKTLPNIAEYIKENTELKYAADYELSDSHINLGSRMGISIISKYPIVKKEYLPLENPHLVHTTKTNETWYSHDKGFLITQIKDFLVITGHCLPFHVFQKDPLDYLYIFKPVDDKLMELYKTKKKIIFCGDFNYKETNLLFPNFSLLSKDLIKEPTRKGKQLDHFLITKEIKEKKSRILENVFDHKVGIFEIDV